MRQNNINLPRSTPAIVVPPVPAALPKGLAPDAGERIIPPILLIDDDPAVRESLRRVLASEGWKVVTAKTGEEALERLEECEPGLMITDLCMAQVSGWDLLFHEHIQRPLLPIFVITALPPQSTNGAAKFATKFFQKPIDLDVLLAEVCFYLTGQPRWASETSVRFTPRSPSARIRSRRVVSE